MTLSVNQTITYPGASSWHSWRPSSDVTHAILVAVLTTVLTYQSISIVHDLAVGLKRRGVAAVSDLSALLLAEESSPLAVVSNLFPGSRVAGWRNHGLLRACPAHDAARRLPPAALAKFVLLLAAAPVVNLVAVILSLEHDATVSFADARFGGISLGYNDSLPINYRDNHINCVRHPTRYARQEFGDAEFSTCFISVGDKANDSSPGSPYVRLSRNVQYKGAPRHAFVAEMMYQPNLLYRWVLHSEVFIRDERYSLKTDMSIEQGKELVENMIPILTDEQPECVGVEETGQIRELEVGQDSWMIQKDLSCRSYSNAYLVGFSMWNIQARIGFVETDRLLLQPVDAGDGEPFADAAQLPFLLRRHSFAPFSHLCIAVLCVLLVRAIVRIATNNDVHKGIEMMLKHTLSVRVGDSMLQNRTRIWYEDLLESPEEKFEHDKGCDSKEDRYSSS